MRKTVISRACYARSVLPQSWIFDGGDPQVDVPIIFSVFVIRTDERVILVDAGCETMPDFTMHDHKSPLLALKEQGVLPSDVTDVIITHAHHDHIECVKHFTNAVVYIQEDEYRHGQQYLKNNPTVHTFKERASLTENVTIVNVGGHSKGSCVVECCTEDGIYVLCGDECYSLYNIQNRIPTANPYSCERSQRFIDTYTKPPYTCLLCHDSGEKGC